MKEECDVQEGPVTTRQPGNSPESGVCFAGVVWFGPHARLRNCPPHKYSHLFRLRELLVRLRPNFDDDSPRSERTDFCRCCLGLSLRADCASVLVTLGGLIF